MHQLRSNISAFGQRLRTIRREKGYSMERFCEEFNKNSPSVLAKSTISRWEAGAREPMLSYVEALAQFFGVSVAWLLGHTDSRDGSDLPPEPVAVDDYQEAVNLVYDKLSIQGRLKLLTYAY